MKYGQKLKLGDAHVTPRNIQEVQASKFGDAPRHPFFINKKYQVIFQHTIFLLLYMLCVFSWRIFIFAFSFLLFCLLQ
jgi:hypothetical protein